MQTNQEIIDSVFRTFEKANCTLSEDQKTVLHGSLHVWFDEIRKDQKEKDISAVSWYGFNKAIVRELIMESDF